MKIMGKKTGGKEQGEQGEGKRQGKQAAKGREQHNRKPQFYRPPSRNIATGTICLSFVCKCSDLQSIGDLTQKGNGCLASFSRIFGSCYCFLTYFGACFGVYDSDLIRDSDQLRQAQPMKFTKFTTLQYQVQAEGHSIAQACLSF